MKSPAPLTASDTLIVDGIPFIRLYRGNRPLMRLLLGRSSRLAEHRGITKLMRDILEARNTKRQELILAVGGGEDDRVDELDLDAAEPSPKKRRVSKSILDALPQTMDIEVTGSDGSPQPLKVLTRDGAKCVFAVLDVQTLESLQKALASEPVEKAEEEQAAALTSPVSAHKGIGWHKQRRGWLARFVQEGKVKTKLFKPSGSSEASIARAEEEAAEFVRLRARHAPHPIVDST